MVRWATMLAEDSQDLNGTPVRGRRPATLAGSLVGAGATELLIERGDDGEKAGAAGGGNMINACRDGRSMLAADPDEGMARGIRGFVWYATEDDDGAGAGEGEGSRG